MILFSHPTGNANVRHAALAFAEAGMLGEFWTCIGWDPDGWMNRFLPRGVRGQLARRALPAAVRAVARYRPWRESGRLFCLRAGFSHPLRHERGVFSIDAVYRDFDRAIAGRLGRMKGVSAVYAYEDGASLTFAAAAVLGLPRLYDLPIGYWRAGHAIFREEAERVPEWSATLSGMNDSKEKLERKDEELRLASTVFVASTFTRLTLASFPGVAKTVYVIPYGAPVMAADAASPAAAPERKLKVLFAGSLGQRKGLSYLLRAVELLKGQVELTLIGRKGAEGCAPLEDAVKRHRWIPSLPHAEILREMERHDVFVFPSLFEGFGLVILEAMSRGLPVVTTSHTAGPDVITDGVDGFIVPIRSAEAIAEKLDLLAGDRALLAQMKHAALETARRNTWENYRHRLVEAASSPLAAGA